MNKKEIKFNILLLKKQYVFLSKLEEEFPKNSTHKAYLKIDKLSSEVLNELEFYQNELKKLKK